MVAGPILRAVRRALRTARALLPLALLGGMAQGGGCQKALFPDNTPRTQFERYDTLRGGAAPAEEPDVFGRPQPALRARLSPQTSP